MKKPLDQLIFEYRMCDKKHIKKMVNYIVSRLLEPFLQKRAISNLEKEFREEVYKALETYCRLAPLDTERLSCLFDSLSQKLHLESHRKSVNHFCALDIKHVEALKTLHEYVTKEILDTTTPSVEQSLQWATYFLITSSGACFKELADAAVQKIQGKKNPIERVGEFHLMETFYIKGSHFSNAKDTNNQPVTRRLLFIEPTTLVAIDGFRNRFEKSNEPPPVNKRAFKILSPLLSRAPNARTLKSITERQFLKAATLKVMTNPDSKMSQWLRFFADGSIQSSSMTLRSFKSLLGGSIKTPPDCAIARADIVNATRKEKREHDSYPVKPSQHPFLAEIIEAARCPSTQGFRPVSETKRRLRSLTARDWPRANEILLEWALYELENGTWNKSSTVTRHLSAIGIPWLLVCKDIELIEVDIDQITWIYESILELREAQDASVTNSLRSLLSFTNKHYSFALPEPLQYKKSITMVVNTVPSEVHFRQLQIDIGNCFTDERAEIQEAIQLMLILVRRLFLRPYEVVGIRIKDISINGLDSLLLVRRNPFIFIKTHSAVRQVPAHHLLKKDELDLLQRFLTKRKNQVNGNKNRLLFSTDQHYDVSFSSSTFSRPVTQLLTSYLGEHTPCYQLRHAGQSAMQLILFGSDELIEQLTPYTAKQAEKIKEWLARDGNNETLFQLSSLAGHLSPSMTLSTYAHHTDLLLFQACCNISANYNLQFWQNLSGLRPSTLTKHTNGNNETGHLSGFDILPALRRKRSSKATSTVLKKQSEINCEKITITDFQYSPEDCETALLAYDKDSDNYFSTVTKCGLTPSWASNVAQAAQDIKQHKKYITGRGRNSRLYPIDSLKLAPPAPQSLNERKYVTTIWKKLIEAPENNWFTVRKNIDYLFRHTSHGRSGVTFSTPNQLADFLDCLNLVLPSSAKWCITLEPNTGKTAVDPDKQKSKWEKKSLIEVIVVKNSNVTGKERYPMGRASLHLLKPNLSQKDLEALDNRKYSTNALQYAAHIFVIYQRAWELDQEPED